jgi:methylated-DNA-protein-cysteine methyltransferase related protein
MPSNFYKLVYKIVSRIPRGRVATYGQIAGLLGSPRSARVVGWALHLIHEEDVIKIPWQRVINREGRISTTCQEHNASVQAQLLKKEGVKVTIRQGNYFVDLKKYLWQP